MVLRECAHLTPATKDWSLFCTAPAWLDKIWRMMKVWKSIFWKSLVLSYENIYTLAITNTNYVVSKKAYAHWTPQEHSDEFSSIRLSCFRGSPVGLIWRKARLFLWPAQQFCQLPYQTTFEDMCGYSHHNVVSVIQPIIQSHLPNLFI